MPRRLRIQYSGAMYHVMSRGKRCQDIFLDDVDRQPRASVTKTLAEACQKTDWQVHAYCLTAFCYYLAAPQHWPGWMRVDRFLGEHGLPEDTPAARQEFEGRLQARQFEPDDEAGLKALRRGWCLGSREFKQKRLEEMEGQVGEHHYSQLRLETAEAKGERIIAEELGRLRWQETDLVSRRNHDPVKLAIAQRLRKETTLSVKQIANRLHLGTTRSAGVCLLAASAESAASNPLQSSLGI